MGMIDTSETSLLYESGYNKGFKDGIKGSIPKTDYETRLKADMVAMLTDIQFEIEELNSYESADGQDLVMLADIGILFQQKIDALKEEN